MDKPSDAPMMMAPGHASGAAEIRLPAQDEQSEPCPAVDDEVAWALEAKGNPAIAEMKTKSRARGIEVGKAQGLADAILRAFKRHDVRLDAENRQAILECQDTAFLDRLLDKAMEAGSAAEILAALEKVQEELL